MESTSRRTFVTARAFLLAMGLVLVPQMEAHAIGLRVDLTPSARIEEGWDSNVFNSSKNEVSSFLTRAIPGLDLKFTTPDSVELRLAVNYEKVWYHNSEANKSNSDTWNFRVDTTDAVRLTPSTSIIPSVRYVNSTHAYRVEQLVPTGDPVVPQATITNYGNTKAQTFGGGIRVHHQMKENTTLGLEGQYNNQRFETTTDNAARNGLTDSASYGGGASATYRFTPRTKLGVKFSGSRQTYSDHPDSTVLSGKLIFGYQLHQAVEFEGTFGAEHIRRNESKGHPAASDTNPSGSAAFTYKQELFTAKLYGSGIYTGTSGFGEATRQYTAGLTLTDRFAQDWTWKLAGAYQISRSVFTKNAVDIRAINGETGLHYRPVRWATLHLTGNLDRQTSSGQFGETLTNYSAQLGVTASHTYNIY